MNMTFRRLLSLAQGLVLIALVYSAVHVQGQGPAASSLGREIPPKPNPAPARWRGLIGEYGPDDNILYILEKDGKLCASFKRAEPEPLQEISANFFKFPLQSDHPRKELEFKRGAGGQATQLEFEGTVLKRRPVGPEAGATQLRIKPLRPVPELLKEARTATPPAETGDFL